MTTDTIENLKRRMRYRAVQMLDPQYANPTRYPRFTPGMTTAAYIAAFQLMNATHRAGMLALPPQLAFTYRDGPAPMLDPDQPELTVETFA